jgi:hypothetical protein
VRQRAGIIALSVSLLAFALSATAQELAPFAAPAATTASGGMTEPETRVVPRAFRTIELGMEMDEVKALLSADGMFAYRGDPDVSLLPRPNESLIEVSGISYVRRAFFQFYEGKLFVMIFALNEKEMDHYSVFTSLSIKYGKPDSLSPSESVWTDDATRLSVERPLAVKYIDLAVFNALKTAGTAQQSYEELLRTEFLGGF